MRDRYNNRRYRGDVWNNISTYLTRNIKFYYDTFIAFTYRIRRGLGHLSKVDRCWIVIETRTWSSHQNIAPINDDGRTITRRNKHSHYGPQKLQIKDLRFRQDCTINKISYDKVDYLLFSYYSNHSKKRV